MVWLSFQFYLPWLFMQFSFFLKYRAYVVGFLTSLHLFMLFEPRIPPFSFPSNPPSTIPLPISYNPSHLASLLIRGGKNPSVFPIRSKCFSSSRLLTTLISFLSYLLFKCLFKIFIYLKYVCYI